VDVLIVLIFVSLVLVTAAVVLFIMRVKAGDFEHGERLSLLPLDDDRTGSRAEERGQAVPEKCEGEQ
jgi:cbb3-type cytochrome oxidase maturation protein